MTHPAPPVRTVTAMLDTATPLQDSRQADAVLLVDLDAIVENWRRIGRALTPGSRAAAVVKADGYGLGAIPVATALSRAGCRRFFVATLEEGVALRGALPDSEILVLNGLTGGDFACFHQHRLTPVLASVEQAVAWQTLALQLQVRLPTALQIDSGMNRLGVSPTDAGHLAARADFGRLLDLSLILSHLACSDSADHPMNDRQLQIFDAVSALFPGVERSLAASSGVFLGPAFHGDWVRPGAALYGLNPTPGRPNPMAPAVRLQAKILQRRQIDAPATVGYGATFAAAAGQCLATVALGYADGFMRSLGNRGQGHIGDKQVPLVGRVSMDLTVFDVTRIAPADSAPGRMIDLIGPHQSLDALAQTAGTIGYEILTSLGARIERRYLTSQNSMNPLATIGRFFLGFLAAVGRLTVFTGVSLSHCVRRPIYFRLIGKQMIEIGYFSLPVVGLTAIFTGMVLALQSHTGFSRFAAEGAVATVVVISMTRELGPVLAGLMVAGRIGAAMAAEIGTMRVTEQVDALTTLSTNPFKYLVAPRIISGLLMLPCLVLVADIIGVFGGFLVGTYQLGYNPATYIHSSWDYLKPMDVISGLVKASAFGLIITLMGCYHGYHSRGGAQGVGQATTNAVVSASILILTSNYIITALFFSK